MTTREFQQTSGLRIFLSYFRPHRKLFLLDMACALCVSLIDLAFPYVSRWCMYELLPKDAYRTFFAVMAVVLLAFAVILCNLLADLLARRIDPRLGSGAGGAA